MFGFYLSPNRCLQTLQADHLHAL